jgi:hypothetical protein
MMLQGLGIPDPQCLHELGSLLLGKMLIETQRNHQVKFIGRLDIVQQGIPAS